MLFCVALCGLGRRFADAGFRAPKPFLKIGGRTLLQRVVDSLELGPDDRLLLVAPAEHRHRGLEALGGEVVYLYEPTEGALDTLVRGVSKIDYNGPLVCVDADTFYPPGVVRGLLRAFGEGHDAAVAVFREADGRDCFSFARLDAAGRVAAVAEKRRVSDWALSGLYAFRSAARFLAAGRAQLAEPTDAPERYLSALVHRLAAGGAAVAPLFVAAADVRCVGTPEQWVQALVDDKVGETKRLRVCFDLDNTLVTAPRVPGDYATVSPIAANVAFAQRLAEQGHTVIIHTARRMRTHGGNAGAALADVAAVTFRTLEAFGIPHDEVHFGKPHADAYVDDLAVDAREVLAKALGVLDGPTEVAAARDFNSLFVTDTRVVKASRDNRRKLAAEVAWYRCAPPRLAHWFPALLEAGEASYATERVRRPTFAWLFLRELLTPAMLTTMLGQLRELHATGTLRDPANALLYGNYLPKWRKRAAALADLGAPRDRCAAVEAFLERYQAGARAVPARVHGDPVFTNVFWNGRHAVFIDMGGLQCDVVTPHGDALYDYAKVLQSLTGYDEVLADRAVGFAYKAPLLRAFWAHVEEVAPGRKKDVERIRDSLLLSLLPLHSDEAVRGLLTLV